MRSKRRRDGYLMIDHRASPGLTAADVAGFPGQVVPGGTVLEAATYVCAHCQALVVINPARTRDRGWCSRCDAYVCDGCVALGECRPIAMKVDEMLNLAIRGDSK